LEKVVEIVSTYPFFIETFLINANSPLQCLKSNAKNQNNGVKMTKIPKGDMLKALKSINKLLKGIAPVGNYWIMNKTAEKMDKKDKVRIPSKLDVIAALNTI